MTLGCKTDGVDEEACMSGTAILSLDIPLVCVFVILCANNSGVESNVFLYIKDLFYMVEVTTKFCKAGVFLRPVPVLRGVSCVCDVALSWHHAVSTVI